MIRTWMFITLVMSYSAFAEEFSHVKLSPQFEQYLNQPKLKSLQKPEQDEFNHKIRHSLLGAKNRENEFSSPFPADGEESPLYEQIRSYLEASHTEIGAREVSALDVLNQQFNMGTQNFSGFSWQKPFGVVHVWADRQVVPNLFGSNWLIQDTFTFDIAATTFLEQTNEAGITSMSDAEIGAFAGVTFKRVYTYYHYANSYAEGLRADFSKLFLPFLKMNPAGIARMSHEEIMKKEDNWTISAGGMITSPSFYGFSLSGGMLAQYAYQNLVSIQNNNDPAASPEKIRLSVKGKNAASVSVNMSLQVDFYKLLKLTILNYDLNYEYAKAKEFTLGLSANDWQSALADETKGPELRQIIRGHGEVKSLESYVLSLDEEESSSLSQRGSLLVWGRLAKSKTEQVRVIKDEQVRVFFKSYAQNLRVVQNVFSRLFSAVIYKLLKLPFGTKNAALYNREFNMEYEATHPQASNPNIARIDSTEQFSFVLNQSYEAARTDRWVDQKYKNDMIWFVDSFTTLPKDYKSIIRQEQLKGPMMIESVVRVEKTGFNFLLASSVDSVFAQIARVCKSGRAAQWTSPSQRFQMLHTLQVGKDLCVKTIGNHFIDFKTDYQANALKPSLAKFKSFLTKYYKKAESLSDLTALFGPDNTFIHGQLKATTSQNGQFVTPFSSGQFRGMGVIDNYKRVDGQRQPASIISE